MTTPNDVIGSTWSIAGQLGLIGFSLKGGFAFAPNGDVYAQSTLGIPVYALWNDDVSFIQNTEPSL